VGVVFLNRIFYIALNNRKKNAHYLGGDLSWITVAIGEVMTQSQYLEAFNTVNKRQRDKVNEMNNIIG